MGCNTRPGLTPWYLLLANTISPPIMLQVTPCEHSIKRGAPPGRSFTHSSARVPTVAGSNTTRSACIPGRIRPLSAAPEASQIFAVRDHTVVGHGRRLSLTALQATPSRWVSSEPAAAVCSTLPPFLKYFSEPSVAIFCGFNARGQVRFEVIQCRSTNYALR
jgi:hypothetical protein